MIKLPLLLTLLFATIAAPAQRVYFIYLQAEQEQPFFIKMNEKVVYSSSEKGYLIMSKLVDSSYTFKVGFPSQKWPDQQFSVPIQSKDHGYLLKNFGDKGWGLFDLQTLAVQMASNNQVSGNSLPRTDKSQATAFANVLARAADDTTLLTRPVAPVVVKEEVKTETVVPVSKTEPLATPVKKEPEAAPARIDEKTVPVVETTKVETPPVVEPKKEEPKKEEVVIMPAKVEEKPVVNPVEKTVPVKPTPEVDEVKPAASYTKSTITRNTGTSNNEGMGYTFIDKLADGGTDTIHIIIPNPAVAVPQTVLPVASEVKPSQPVTQPVQPLQEKKFIESISSDTTAPVKPVTTTPAVAKTSLKKPDCKAAADENDFMKLRRKMVAEKDDDDMVDEARKYFRTKCFTTQQVRNLSGVFLDDLGKYKFFDMAYFFVSDRENFATLQSELRNEYYISRFKAMLSN